MKTIGFKSPRRGKKEVFDSEISQTSKGLEEWRVQMKVGRLEFLQLLSILGDTTSNHKVIRHARKFIKLVMDCPKEVSVRGSTSCRIPDCVTLCLNCGEVQHDGRCEANDVEAFWMSKKQDLSNHGINYH